MSILIWKSTIAANYLGVWWADMRTYCGTGESLQQPEAHHSFLCQYVAYVCEGAHACCVQTSTRRQMRPFVRLHMRAYVSSCVRP